jgi:hypothetical protein
MKNKLEWRRIEDMPETLAQKGGKLMFMYIKESRAVPDGMPYYWVDDISRYLEHPPDANNLVIYYLHGLYLDDIPFAEDKTTKEKI